VSVSADDPKRRRLDRILEAGFGDGLEDLSIEEVRERRDDCLAEREFLSYLRRLLQGRLEILRDERAARTEGRSPDERPIEEKLAELFAQETPQGPGRGEALRVELPEEEMMLARRRVERILNTAAFSNPGALSDEDLASAIESLEAEERDVSDTRRTVLDLHDVLQDEVKRRYRDRLAAEGLRG